MVHLTGTLILKLTSISLNVFKITFPDLYLINQKYLLITLIIHNADPLLISKHYSPDVN